MTTKRQTGTMMKILAAVLILASAAMFFLPWMNLTLTVDGKTGTINELLKEEAKDQGMTVQQMTDQVVDEAMEELEDLQIDGGPQFDLQNVKTMIKTALKGAWSPLDLLSMIGGAKKAIPQFMNAYNQVAGVFSDESLISILSQADSYARTAHLILLILVILCLAMAAVAIVCALTDHRMGMLPYVIFALMMLVLFIVLVASGNKKLDDPAGGILGYRISDYAALKLCAWGFLCVALAILGFAAMFLPFGAKTAALGGAASAAAAGWLCPNCGVMRRADQKFCLTCGAKQPERQMPRAAAPGGWKCPNCGTTLKADQRFCLYCGSKKPEAAPTPAPAAPAAQVGWTCPGCGARLTGSQKFCPRCGAKQPAAPAAPAAQAGWTCPGCGSKLNSSQKFCPHCGTRQPAAPAAPAAQAGWTCSGCGAKLSGSQKFCPYCGTKQPAASAAPAPAAPANWTCPSCGAVHAPDLKFCPKCGTKQPEATPAPAAPAPRVCKNCGTALVEGMGFCPKCGTKAEEPVPAVEPVAPVSAAPAEGEPGLTAPADTALDLPAAETAIPAPEAPTAPEKPAAPAEGESGGFRPAGDDDL